jgi:VanZ family protein
MRVMVAWHYGVKKEGKNMACSGIRKTIWLVLLLIAPLFFWGGPGYHSPRMLKELWDLGHVVFFGLLAWVIGCLLEKRGERGIRRCGIPLFIVTVVALAVEGVQRFLPGRTASFADFLLGFGGGAVVVIFFFLPEKWNSWSRYLRTAGVIAVGGMLVPFAMTAVDEYCSRRDFPLLAGFETSLELSRWSNEDKMERVREPVLAGNFSAFLHLAPGKYSGVSLQYFPGNWKSAKRLAFSIYNPGEPVMLHYRVHDVAHRRGDRQLYGDRFNGMRRIVRGWNTIVVPVEDIKNGPVKRNINLAAIEGFGVFLVDNREKRVLYIDEVKLDLDGIK